MYTSLLRAFIRFNLRKHQARDVDGLLKAYAKDARFVFPGTSSWAADVTGRENIRPWLERFHAEELDLEVHDILVNGPPWNMRFCLQFTDQAQGRDGSLVYENRGVIYGKGAWGKITFYEVFEDTEKVAAFDRYLSARGSVS